MFPSFAKIDNYCLMRSCCPNCDERDSILNSKYRLLMSKNAKKYFIDLRVKAKIKKMGFQKHFLSSINDM